MGRYVARLAIRSALRRKVLRLYGPPIQSGPLHIASPGILLVSGLSH